MKKSVFYNYMMAMAFASTLTISSCGDDDPADPVVPGQPDQPTNPDQPSQDKAMSPAAQKERMDAIAQEFMKLTPASDFQSYADLSDYVYNTYREGNYDWDSVNKWARSCWDVSRKATGKTTTKDFGWGAEVYTEYTSLLLASNFTGHFRANNGRWIKESGTFNDLQFTFTDQNAQTCVLKLETSGNVKKVKAFNLEDWVDYDYDSSNYKYTDYLDRTQYTIGVPENVVVTLTQNGAQLCKTTVKVDLASLSGEDFDISKNSITASALVELSNGYRFNMSQVAYSGNQKCSVVCDISKNGTKLASVSAASDLSGIPSCNVEAFTKSDFDLDDYDTDNATAKNAFVKIDILGKLQLQGVVTDVRKYVDFINRADDNDEDETRFKQWVNSANELTQISLFYDNTSVQQASMKLEAFSQTGWGGYNYWTMEPVLVFFDGSSNSMFDVFFNDTDFKSTIKMFEELIGKYEDLFD